MNDPIVEEVRPFREEHAAQFNYDLAAICADLKRSQKERGLPTVSFEPRRPSSWFAPEQPENTTASADRR